MFSLILGVFFSFFRQLFCSPHCAFAFSSDSDDEAIVSPVICCVRFSASLTSASSLSDVIGPLPLAHLE